MSSYTSSFFNFCDSSPRKTAKPGRTFSILRSLFFVTLSLSHFHSAHTNKQKRIANSPFPLSLNPTRLLNSQRMNKQEDVLTFSQLSAQNGLGNTTKKKKSDRSSVSVLSFAKSILGEGRWHSISLDGCTHSQRLFSSLPFLLFSSISHTLSTALVPTESRQ